MIYSGLRAVVIVMLTLMTSYILNAQPIQLGNDNQQHVNYSMQIDFNAAENKFSGYQKAVYTNNSPDTLQNIFYHLFYNAFQSGSAMEERATHIRDQETTIVRKFMSLKPDEY